MELKMKLKQSTVLKKVNMVKILCKINFNTDDNLPLKKSLKLYLLTIIVKCIFEEDGKFYPQLFLDDCLYEIRVQETLVATNV